AWQSEFAAFEQTHGGLDHALQPEQIAAFEKAFEDAKQVSQWESEFQTENPQGWAAEFAAQETNPAADQDSKEALAKTAGMLLESVDPNSSEKFKNSSFMNFMRRLRDQEVAIEGNKLVEQTAPVISANAGSDWAASFNQQDKGKGKATDWSNEFEQQQQKTGGSTWTTDFEKRIEQHIQNREAGGMMSSEFAKQQESSWAEEFSGVAHMAGGSAAPGDWANQFNDSRQNVAQDWVNEFNSSNAAEELEQAFQQQQNQLNQNESWLRTLLTRSGTNNPYMVADTSKLMDLAARGNLTESILALEAAVQKNPGDAAAWHQLGLRQQENERETMAIAALLKAVEANPKELDAWLALAVSYTNENCRVDAYDALQSWVENSDQYKGVMNSVLAAKGRSAPERHEYVTGLFLEAARTNPGENLDPDVQIALGVLFNVSEEYEKAVDCFRAALNLRPDDYMLWNKYGATLANSHNTTAAIEAYFNALNINPSYIRARYNLAIACINLGQHREAAEHLLSALSLQNAGDAARGLMVGASTAGAQPDGGIGGMSQNVWETLKMAMYMLGRSDLAHRCETTRDLDAFRDEFDF
ncbi:Peroxisomal membrane signal receptor PTS1, partial [Podila epicladia]